MIKIVTRTQPFTVNRFPFNGTGFLKSKQLVMSYIINWHTAKSQNKAKIISLSKSATVSIKKIDDEFTRITFMREDGKLLCATLDKEICKLMVGMLQFFK